jgi:hypothetical protein
MAEGGRLERHGITRASASNGARRLAGSPSKVRRAGVEPARPKAPVPGTGAAANYATSALRPQEARVTDRIRTGPEAMARPRANR